MDSQSLLASSIMSSTTCMSRLVTSCLLSFFLSRPLKRLSCASTSSRVTNGRTVLRGILSTQKSLPVTLTMATCFWTASPGTSDVATDEPGCITWNPVSAFFLGSIKHSCSCPQTTRSSQSGSTFSGKNEVAVCAWWFW